MTQSHDHTVVVGGRIAGLLAARVLADHAARCPIRLLGDDEADRDADRDQCEAQ